MNDTSFADYRTIGGGLRSVEVPACRHTADGSVIEAMLQLFMYFERILRARPYVVQDSVKGFC